LLELSGEGLLILMRGLVRFDTDTYVARRMKGRPGRDYIHSLSNLSAYITRNRK